MAKKKNTPPPDDFDEDDDFDQEAEDRATTAEGECLRDSLALDAGDGHTYPEQHFQVTNAPAIRCEERSLHLPASREGLTSSWRSATVSTERYDFTLKAEKVTCHREVLTCPVTGEHRTGNIEDVGPKGCKFTWNALANLILLIVGTAIPMHRVERLLGSSPFRRPNMVRVLSDFAKRFLPVYLHMAKMLAQANIISGDDTGTRVNEVTRYKKECAKALLLNPENPAHVDKPWEKMREKWKKKGQASLAEELDTLFGFQFLRASKGKKDKERKPKKALQTTVLTGLLHGDDPSSRLVFYRTHFGSVGNLLESLLRWRDLKAKPRLIFQGDLSPSNNVAQIPAGLKLIQAGCAAHARRFFKRYHDQDPVFCNAMLSCFSMIALCESHLDDGGRNSANVVAVRENISQVYWQDAKNVAEGSLNFWSDQTPLGKGIRYLLNGYHKMTRYLSEPRLSPDNNLCENLLRYESLEDNSSFGRASLEGRARYDVARSALATCSFAGAEPRVFVTFIFMAEREALKEHPEHYTPHALQIWLKLAANKADSLDFSAHQAYLAAQRAHKTITQ